MTAGVIQRLDQEAVQCWVPADVNNYLVHTELGMSIRALARATGHHASTILRQVRRNEGRRDDPLVDEVLDRIAGAARSLSPKHNEDETQMIARASAQALPGKDMIESEARRVLRRLSEPDAVLAIAPQMEKAVVVREMPDGRPLRTATLDRAVAEAFVLKDWIAVSTQGKVARYTISQAGRSALKRLLMENDALRQGFAEAPAKFGDQHREWGSKKVREKPGRSAESKFVRYNVIESPLAIIARRKGRDGKPFLSPELVAAGERLREDFELAQMGPRVAQNWDRFLTGGGTRGAFANPERATGPEAAKHRVDCALEELGHGLGDVALRVCCFLEGMEQAEKRMGWAARSGKIVLKIALQRLARHYAGGSDGDNMIG